MSKNTKKIEDGLKTIFQKQDAEWIFQDEPLLTAISKKGIWKAFKKRLEMGEEKYGEEWKIRDNLIEAEDELLDAMAYLIFESKKEIVEPALTDTAFTEELEDIVLGILKTLHNVKKMRMIKESNLF